MRNIITGTLILFSLVLTIPSYAGSGHSHDSGHSHGPVSVEKVKVKALKKVKYLATRGKIDASWSSMTTSKAEKKTFGKNEEWVVSFSNSKIKDKAKNILYIFFSLDGNYIAANYTGK